MRQFRHLSRAEISEIIVSHNAGETQASLAQRFGVDHSTIHYHLNKYQKAYPEQGGIYAVIKVNVRKTCVHPSSRCTLCGKMRDELSRVERETIRQLRANLKDAMMRLRLAGEDVESLDYNVEDESLI